MVRLKALLILTLLAGMPRSLLGQATIAPEEPYREVAAALETWIASEVEAKSIPALSVALVDGSKIVWARGFGVARSRPRIPATAETVYRVGSVSKLFTDLAVMRLVEQGKVDLDAPVSRYLPEFGPTNTSDRPITLRQLMAHRSGLVREPPVGHYFDPTEPSMAATVRSLNDTALIYPPETDTKYSNAGITVVGLVLERLTGEGFSKSITGRLLDPLGLKRSSFEVTPAVSETLAQGRMWTYDGRNFAAPTFMLGTVPAGNLYSNVLDLGRFLAVLFDGGKVAQGSIVSEETLRRMMTQQYGKPGERGNFGLGFSLSEFDGRRRVGHAGAVYGFATEVSALPDEKLGVVAVASLDSANAVTRHIADNALRLMRAARAGKPLPRLESSTAIPAELAGRLEGRYGTPEKGVDILVRDGKVYLTPREGGVRSEVRRLGETLILDDVLTFGPRVEFKDDQVVMAGVTMPRVEVKRPAPSPERWKGLIGEYGWDHNVLYILEKEGKLHALIEWFPEYPLEEVSADVFRFPKTGLYEGESLRFTRDASGRATQVEAAEVVFKRRPIEGEDGATFRIKPLRPVAELRTEALAAEPPRERGEFREPDLVEVVTLDPSIKLDIRYASTNNFMGTPLYTQARAFLQRPVAEALVRIHRKLASEGYGILIHDAYRPWYVTRMFWEATPPASRGFVANPAKGSRHNRGCAIDLTLYARDTGLPVPMVGGYDEFSGRSNPDYPGGTDLQRWHRDLLRRAMEAEGFTVNAAEWWHFDFKDWSSYPILNKPFEAIGTKAP